MNLLEAARMSEEDARAHLESLRWPDGPICPHCKSENVTRLQGSSHRKGAIQCNECREQFTVTVGTVLESSKVPLNKWVLAFHLICSSKKGMSALQLQRELGLGSYRTAWFMSHRIRHAMDNGPLGEMLEGDVEADETYVGGKGTRKRGRGTKSKTPVLTMVERDGKAKSLPVERVNNEHLQGEIRRSVDPKSTIITDEWRAYIGIGDHFEGGHSVVRHRSGEFQRGPVNTNTVESFFALLKRGHYGTFHSWGRKHLHRYCIEFAFRWNHRKISDSERRDVALGSIVGKRLMWKPGIGLMGSGDRASFLSHGA